MNSFSQIDFNFNKVDKSKYRIAGEVVNLPDTSVLLAYYFGGKQYATDTAYSKNGIFVFEGDKELDGGMYMIVLPNQLFFDLVISEQFFSFSTILDPNDQNSLINNMTFSQSKENTPFYEYLKFIMIKQNQAKVLKQKGNNELLANLDIEVKNYRENFEKKYSDLFFTKVLRATQDPILPDPPKNLKDEKEIQLFQFESYRDNYWINVDFSDKRILRTPIFFNKMDTYLNKLTVQHPDSISKAADILVRYSRLNKDIFQYVVSYITSTYERSKIMGMDAVFVHMVENYYMTGEVDWVDDDQLVKIEERAEKIAPNLIGRPAPPFVNQLGMPFMKDPEGKIKRLYDLESKYTLLIFYAPDCGHCKKELPRVKKVLDTLTSTNILDKKNDVSVFAVQTEFDREKWLEFIEDQGTGDWINVCDMQTDPDGNPAASSNWRDQYDIYSTPVIYILDKDKNILAKRIAYNQISQIIKREEGIE